MNSRTPHRARPVSHHCIGCPVRPHIECEVFVVKGGPKISQGCQLTPAQLPTCSLRFPKNRYRVDALGAGDFADENRLLATQQAHRSRLEKSDRLDCTRLLSDIPE